MENRKDLLIYGFGGFGHEVACLINHINAEEPRWNLLGYIDDGVAVGTECRYGKVLAHLQSSVFKLSKDLIDSIHEEGIVAYTS